MNSLRLIPPTRAPWSAAAWRAAWRAGPEAVPAWESALAARLGATAVRTAASGRAALHLLLRRLAAERPTRREIILPAYTCPALFKVIADAELVARPLPTDPATLGYAGDPGAAVTERTLALLIVHTLGLPQPVTAVAPAVRAAGAVVIEDAAQALGATVAGRPAGTTGDFGLYSFGPGKPLSTGGGGAVSAEDPAGAALLDRAWAGVRPQTGPATAVAAARLALLAALFTPRGWWLADRLRLNRLGDSAAAQGYAVRGLTPFQAAFGAALLPELDRWNARRRAVAARWRDFFDGRDDIALPAASPGAIYLRFPLLAPDRAARERLVARYRARGLAAGRLWPAVADPIAPRLLTLPTFTADAPPAPG